jgi:hypothetical protein
MKIVRDCALHAGVCCESKQRKKLERICCYITQPPISEPRLSIAASGNIVYSLKTPNDDGTTHIVLSPLVFIGRLAALVPIGFIQSKLVGYW